jgi:FG-GAP-like repeat/Fibronectin type III domain
MQRVMCVLFSAAMVAGASVSASAATITLAWDPSPADISYYILHVGNSSGRYSQQVNVGKVTTYTYPNVNDSLPYYFAVQAVNGVGVASPLSLEVVRGVRQAPAPDWGTDGTPDILWRHKDGWLGVWNLNGVSSTSGTYLNPNMVADPNWEIVATKDMNGDGRLDLIWQHKTMGWIGTWHMNGTALLNENLFNPSQVDPQWKIVAAADMNGDGKNDLIWQHTSGLVGAWLMNDTTLIQSVLFSPSGVPPDTWRIVAAGDLNHDGHPDLFWQHVNGLLGAWLMQGTNMVQSVLLNPSQVAGGSVWQIKGMADFNQDGRLDLLWQHRDGYVAVWYLNGLTVIGGAYLNPDRVPVNTWQIVGPK